MLLLLYSISSSTPAAVQGLAVGFVMLRFESLVEEGKI
jgi:hypothetical protein